jgi:hypothetical protein
VKDYAGMISEEQVELLDLDAVAWFATDEAVDGDPATVPLAKD